MSTTENSAKDLLLDVDGPIATVTINRPDRRNAVTMAMWQRLPDLVQQIDSDAGVRVVIVTGAGDRAFAAGSDIAELPAMYENPETSADYDRTMLEAQKALSRCTRPVIAMIQGPCIGGGVGIATACDLRFAANGATFCVPPARLGVVYGLSATKRLAALVGISTTRDLLFSARTISAAEAWHLGLVDRVEADDCLVEVTREYALSVADNSAFSHRATKQTLRRIVDDNADDDESFYALVRESVAGPDFAEGFAAFQEKRKPDFS